MECILGCWSRSLRSARWQMTDEAADAVKTLINHIRHNYNDDEIAYAYNEVRSQILKELYYDELTLVRMLELLLELFHENRDVFGIILAVLADPLVSFRTIAEQSGVSATTVWRHIQAAAAKYPEIELLMRIRKKDREQVRRRNGRFGRVGHPEEGQQGRPAGETPPPPPGTAGPYPMGAGDEVERAGSTHR